MIKKIFLLIGILLLIESFSFAETIVTKSGKTIEGKIVEQTDEYIKVDIGVGIPITYFLDEIESIDGKTISPPAQQQPLTSQPERTSALLEPETNPNTYIDEENGIQLIFPSGWYVVSGKAEREETRKVLEEKLAPDKLAKSTQDKSNDKPMSKSELEFVSELADGLKEIGMAFAPLVTAYKHEPNTINKDYYYPFIELKIKRDSKGNSEDYLLEDSKIQLQQFTHIMKSKIIEPLSEININNIKGIKMTYEAFKGPDLFIKSECILVKGNKTYTLSIVSRAEDYEKYKADFARTVNSLQIK